MNRLEKALAYDKAIAELKKYEGSPTLWSYSDMCEKFFPELAESEDERIRKEILAFINRKKSLGSVNSEELGKSNSWIAWLEKQGEQKPKELFDIPENGIENDVSVTSRLEHIPEQLKPIAKFILDYAHWNLHKDEWNHPVPEVPLFRVLDALVQEGKPYQGCDSCIEQKPVEWSEEDEGWLDNAIVSCEQCGNTDTADWLKSLKDRIQPQQEWNEKYIADVFEKVGLAKIAREQGYDALTEAIQSAMIKLSKFTPQPKQDWSEEDETNASYIVAALDCYYRLREERNNTNGQENLDKARNWLYNKLKSLRPQKKQEWNWDDANILRDIDHILGVYKDKYHGTKSIEPIKEWLSSLNPQNRWKPSDEQMEALKEACDEHWEPDGLDPLYILWEQLKKLRKE